MKSRIVILLVGLAVVLAAVIVALVANGGTDATEQTFDPSLAPVESSGDKVTAETTSGGDPLDTTRSLAEAQADASGEGNATGGQTAVPPVEVPLDDGSGDSVQEPAQVQPDNEAEQEVADESGVRFGLTLDERKACYWDLVAAEDRAVAEAEAAYPLTAEKPDLDAHLSLRLSLTDKYTAAVREEYNITPDEMTAIINEGIRNYWPMPPLD